MSSLAPVMTVLLMVRGAYAAWPDKQVRHYLAELEGIPDASESAPGRVGLSLAATDGGQRSYQGRP